MQRASTGSNHDTILTHSAPAFEAGRLGWLHVQPLTRLGLSICDMDLETRAGLEAQLCRLEVRVDGQGLLELGDGPVELAVGDVDLGAEGHRPGAPWR